MESTNVLDNYCQSGNFPGHMRSSDEESGYEYHLQGDIYLQPNNEMLQVEPVVAYNEETSEKLEYPKSEDFHHMRQEMLVDKKQIKNLESECSELRNNKKGLEIQLEQLKLRRNNEFSSKLFGHNGSSVIANKGFSKSFDNSDKVLFSNANVLKEDFRDCIKYTNKNVNTSNEDIPDSIMEKARNLRSVQTLILSSFENKSNQYPDRLAYNFLNNSVAPLDETHSRSFGTQTGLSLMEDFENISFLADALEGLTSKYKVLCKEKAILEQTLEYTIKERDTETYRFMREREIRQKCMIKMEKMKEERDAAVTEHSLVMSERDVVHKEINQLQDQLAEQTTLLQEAQNKIESLEKMHRTQDITLTEEDRVMFEFDQALNDNQSGERMSKKNLAPNFYNSFNKKGSLDRNALKNVEMKRMMDDYMATASVWMKDSFNENDSLKRQLQQKVTEFSNILQELSDLKMRCNWAFSERDRIVKERDSMRTMCDKLRQDRDNTVNELIKAIKESDELKKQRNQASSDLKALQEMHGSNSSDRCARDSEDLISHSYSKDSAIDSDFQEWETEIINLDIGLNNIGSLGFELGGGVREGNIIQPVYIKNLLSCSPAYGIIQANDQIIHVNNIDVTRADKSYVCQLIRKSPRPVHMLVKRKKSFSKLFSASQTSQVITTGSQQWISKPATHCVQGVPQPAHSWFPPQNERNKLNWTGNPRPLPNASSMSYDRKTIPEGEVSSKVQVDTFVQTSGPDEEVTPG